MYKYSISDYVTRITTSYPFYDFEQFQDQFKIQNDWFTIRAYHNRNTSNNAFAGRFAGKTIEQTLLPNEEWLNLYKSAWQGNVDGYTSENHYKARLYADSFMAQPGSSEYERAKYLALNTYAQAGTKARHSPQSGAKLFEDSGFYNVDLNLDLTQFLDDAIGLQVGGQYRAYSLDSKGSFFNDGILGFNGPIKYSRYGAYAQVSKKVLDEKLKITASGRYDKRKELDGSLTPRASLVYSFGSKRNHNFRLSYQTGFRNPTAQEGYINYWVAPNAFVLGGLKENLEKFQFEDKSGNIVTAKTFFNSKKVFFPSMSPTNIDYQDALKGLKPERNTVYEVGYKGIWNNNFYLDASYAYTTFENFMRNTLLLSMDLENVVIWYDNIKQKVTTHTVNLEGEYKFNSGYKLKINWSYNKLDASNYTDKGNRAITLRYNTPEHRVNTSFGNSDVYNGLGFNISHRINSAYDYASSFGESRIGSFSIIDAALTQKLSKWDALLKIGGTNIFNEKYTFVYGGANIGAMYYVSLKFNDLGNLFKK